MNGTTLERYIDDSMVTECLIGEEWIDKLNNKGFGLLDAKPNRVIFKNNQNKKIYLKYDQKESMYSCGMLNGSESPVAHAPYGLVLKALVGLADIYSN